MDINVDIDVDINDLLRLADYDDLIAFLIENDCTDRMIDHMGEDDMLARIDNDTIAEYACEHCAVDARHD